MFSDWRAAAYIQSNAGSKWHVENEAWRNRIGKIRENKRVLHLPSHKLIHIGEFDEKEAGYAFDTDWATIDWITLGIHTGSPQKKAIHDFLKEKYVIICSFFQHFVGTGRIGEKYGMTLHEFGRVLHLCRLIKYSEEESKELCKNLFFTFVRERVPQQDDENNDEVYHPLLSRSNFVECLIKYSMDVWCKGEEGDQVTPSEILIEIVCGGENYVTSRTSEESKGNEEEKGSTRADIKQTITLKCPEFKNMSVVWKEVFDLYLAYSTKPEYDTIHEVVLNFYHSIKEAFLLFTDDNAHRTGIFETPIVTYKFMFYFLMLSYLCLYVIFLPTFV